MKIGDAIKAKLKNGKWFTGTYVYDSLTGDKVYIQKSKRSILSFLKEECVPAECTEEQAALILHNVIKAKRTFLCLYTGRCSHMEIENRKNVCKTKYRCKHKNAL